MYTYVYVLFFFQKLTQNYVIQFKRENTTSEIKNTKLFVFVLHKYKNT